MAMNSYMGAARGMTRGAPRITGKPLTMTPGVQQLQQVRAKQTPPSLRPVALTASKLFSTFRQPRLPQGTAKLSGGGRPYAMM